jgi:hypothetical protein
MEIKWFIWEQKRRMVKVSTPSAGKNTERRGLESNIFDSIEWRMGSEWTLGRLGWGRGVEQIQLPQDWDRWQALVNTVTNLRVLVPHI